MAIGVITDGPTLVQVNTGEGGALQNVGYTRNGVSASSHGFFLPVHSDDNGGDEGPASEVQYLGETWEIEMEFTKFDTQVADTIRPRMFPGGAGGATLGVPGTPGSLMFSGGFTYRLLLVPTNRPLNFPQVIFQNPFQINKGTRFSTWVLRATAYKNAAGILFNTATT